MDASNQLGLGSMEYGKLALVAPVGVLPGFHSHKSVWICLDFSGLFSGYLCGRFNIFLFHILFSSLVLWLGCMSPPLRLGGQGYR